MKFIEPETPMVLAKPSFPWLVVAISSVASLVVGLILGSRLVTPSPLPGPIPAITTAIPTPFTSLDPLTLLKDLAAWRIEEDVSSMPYASSGTCADGQSHNPKYKIMRFSFGANNGTQNGGGPLYENVNALVSKSGWTNCTAPVETSNPDGTTPNRTYTKDGKMLSVSSAGSMGVGNTTTVVFEY